MTTNDFISAREMLQIVTDQMSDQNYASGFSRGWYMDKIRHSVKDLNRKTKLVRQVYTFVMPKDLRLSLPAETSNVIDVSLFNGECCETTYFEPVHWKRNMSNQGTGGKGYDAHIMEKSPGGSIHDYSRSDITRASRLYFCEAFDSHIEFSPSCSAFENVRVWLTPSIRFDKEDFPVIPYVYREGIEFYIQEMFFRSKRMENPNMYNNMYRAAMSDRKTAYDEIAMVCNTMDQFKRRRMLEYLTHHINK